MTRLQTRHGLEIEERFGYSQGLEAGGLIYVAGQVPRDETGNPIPQSGLTAHFEKTASNICAVLERLGGSLERLVYVQLHVTADLERSWNELTALNRRFFAKAAPAGTIIQVDGLNHPDYLIEISAVATRGATKEASIMAAKISSWPVGGVSRRPDPIADPSWTTIAAAIFVPPTSIPSAKRVPAMPPIPRSPGV